MLAVLPVGSRVALSKHEALMLGGLARMKNSNTTEGRDRLRLLRLGEP
jgi:hypothetical protein